MRQDSGYLQDMTSNTMISFPIANYTTVQFELFSVVGFDKAAAQINRWLNEEVDRRATDINAENATKVGVEIRKAIEAKIVEAGYHKEFGALDSEPGWLIAAHIAECVQTIAGLPEDSVSVSTIYIAS